MISTKATIQSEKNVSDRLIATLRPFISQVGQGIRNGQPLKNVIDDAAILETEAAKSFVIESEVFGLKSDLLFAKDDRIDGFVFTNRATGQKVFINQLSEDEVQEVADIILHLSGSIRKQEAFCKFPYPRLLGLLYDAEIFVEDSVETGWTLLPQDIGIVRLQHASFLLKSTQAQIIVDPHFVSSYSSHLQHTSRMLPENFRSVVDAVLITHSHKDHYHVPSLMMLPRDVTIVVPQSIEESILSPNFGRELRSLGFKNVIELGWYSDPVRIGDIEISALPFYGEQPLRYEFPRDKNLRNWGNSYFFQTPAFNAFCLIDSGSDAQGSMLQVADFVKQKYGAVDAILSNLHEFHVGVGRGNPFYVTGNGLYWLSLTTDQIANFPKLSGDLITLGAEGVAEICRISGAKTFLPYSHLWSEIGSVPSNEVALLQELSMKPGMHESRTIIQNWRIGDSWQP